MLRKNINVLREIKRIKEGKEDDKKLEIKGEEGVRRGEKRREESIGKERDKKGKKN